MSETFRAVSAVGQATSRNSLDIGEFIRGLLAAGETDLYHKVHFELDRIVLREVLNHVSNNQVQASELLGISRTTLRAKLSAFGTEDAAWPQVTK